MNKKLPRIDNKLGEAPDKEGFWIISNNSNFLNETRNLCVFSSVSYALYASYSSMLLIMILKQPQYLMITRVLMKFLKCSVKSILK